MILRLLLGAAAVAIVAGLFAGRAASKMPDFEVYHRAGTRALAGEPLYREEDGHYQHKYLPAFALLAAPAALLPLTVAKALWFGASVAIVVWVLRLSLHLLPSLEKPPWVLVAITTVAMAKFYAHELVLGQVNLLFAAAALRAVHALAQGRERLAGALVALAIVVKPYAVIFLPWLAVQRAVGAVAAVIAGLLAIVALPAAIYGLTGTAALHADWWRTVTRSTAPNLLNADNVSLAGMYAKWMGPGTVAASWTAGTAAVLLAAAAIAFARRRHVASPAGLEASLLLVLVPLLSPQGWDYVFLLSTPAVMYLVNYDRALPAVLRWTTRVALATIAFSLFDVMGREAYRAFMDLSVISVCYLVVTGALVTLRLVRAA